jgi:hypothetical protein
VSDAGAEHASAPVLVVVGGLVVLGGIALICALVLIPLAARRRRERRATDGRIALRLAALSGPGPDPVVPA